MLACVGTNSRYPGVIATLATNLEMARNPSSPCKCILDMIAEAPAPTHLVCTPHASAPPRAESELELEKASANCGVQFSAVILLPRLPLGEPCQCVAPGYAMTIGRPMMLTAIENQKMCTITALVVQVLGQGRSWYQRQDLEWTM